MGNGDEISTFLKSIGNPTLQSMMNYQTQAARFKMICFPPFRAYANLRQSSLDGMTTSRGHHSHHHKPRSSSSETNLRKLTMGEFGGGLAGLGAGGSAPPGGRPGSALGLLQGRTRGEQNLTLRHLPDTLYLVTQSSSSIYTILCATLSFVSL